MLEDENNSIKNKKKKLEQSWVKLINSCIDETETTLYKANKKNYKALNCHFNYNYKYFKEKETKKKVDACPLTTPVN